MLFFPTKPAIICEVSIFYFVKYHGIFRWLMGTWDPPIVDIICLKTNEEIDQLKKEYKLIKGDNLIEIVQDLTSGPYER